MPPGRALKEILVTSLHVRGRSVVQLAFPASVSSCVKHWVLIHGVGMALWEEGAEARAAVVLPERSADVFYDPY